MASGRSSAKIGELSRDDEEKGLALISQLIRLAWRAGLDSNQSRTARAVLRAQLQERLPEESGQLILQ